MINLSNNNDPIRPQIDLSLLRFNNIVQEVPGLIHRWRSNEYNIKFCNIISSENSNYYFQERFNRNVGRNIIKIFKRTRNTKM